MAEVSNIAKGPYTGCFSTNLPHSHKPKNLSSLRLGSELKGVVSYCGLKHEIVSAQAARFPLKVCASVVTTEKPSTAPEIVLHPIKEISGTVRLPGSKSLSNRILLLAALSEVLKKIVFCFCLGNFYLSLFEIYAVLAGLRFGEVKIVTWAFYWQLPFL